MPPSPSIPNAPVLWATWHVPIGAVRNDGHRYFTLRSMHEQGHFICYVQRRAGPNHTPISMNVDAPLDDDLYAMVLAFIAFAAPFGLEPGEGTRPVLRVGVQEQGVAMEDWRVLEILASSPSPVPERARELIASLTEALECAQPGIVTMGEIR